MCCESMSHHRGRHHGGFCRCHSHPHSGLRRPWTNKEKAAYFEQYLEELREEVKNLEEAVAELKGEKN